MNAAAEWKESSLCIKMFYALKQTKHIIMQSNQFLGQQCKPRNVTFPESLIDSKFTSYAVLCTEPVILTQLIRGHGVSGPCLHVTTYYTTALVMLFIKNTVLVCCLSHVQSHFVIILSLDLSLLFGNSSDQMKLNLHSEA